MFSFQFIKGSRKKSAIPDFMPKSHTCSNTMHLPRRSAGFSLPSDRELFALYDYAFKNTYILTLCSSNISWRKTLNAHEELGFVVMLCWKWKDMALYVPLIVRDLILSQYVLYTVEFQSEQLPVLCYRFATLLKLFCLCWQRVPVLHCFAYIFRWGLGNEGYYCTLCQGIGVFWATKGTSYSKGG